MLINFFEAVSSLNVDEKEREPMKVEEYFNVIEDHIDPVYVEECRSRKKEEIDDEKMEFSTSEVSTP